MITSNDNTPYNAIDGSLLVDAQGQWWLTFGSFANGIYMVSIDPATGKQNPSDLAVHHLADRPGTGPHELEAPFVYYHAGYYYLFTSWGKCCLGAESTYSIHVGRSTTPTGPYFDALNNDLVDGGGTLLLDKHDYVKGPGGQSVYGDDYLGYHDLLVYHYYDTRLNGNAFLGINYLGWNSNGFPYVY